MRHTFIAIVGLLTLAGASPAWATATLFCEAHDQIVDFDIMGYVPDQQGSPLLQIRAELKAAPDGISDKTEPVAMGDANRTQYWFDTATLNLVLYAESEPMGAFSSTELTIKTTVRAEDDAYFDGTYHLTRFLPPTHWEGDSTEMQVDGKVTCSVG